MRKIALACALASALVSVGSGAAEEKKSRTQVLVSDMGTGRIVLQWVDPCTNRDVLAGIATAYDNSSHRVGFKSAFVELHGVRMPACWRPMRKFIFRDGKDAKFKFESPAIAEVINAGGTRVELPMDDFKFDWVVY